ncbi:MAG: phosphomannomutase, partial [Sulfitobacter sp.]
TQDIVKSAGGVAVQSKTGHAFIKQELRNCDAVYGGEMSAHHYFRDFVYCDSGMIPWLLVAELLGRRNQDLDALIDQRRAAFPSSGEINFKLDDPKAAIARVIAKYETSATARDDMDGVGLSFADWRFNLRSSNTEPVVRLNVESRGNPEMLAQKTAAIEALLKGG